MAQWGKNPDECQPLGTEDCAAACCQGLACRSTQLRLHEREDIRNDQAQGPFALRSGAYGRRDHCRSGDAASAQTSVNFCVKKKLNKGLGDALSLVPGREKDQGLALLVS
jgi:hypothetical protein